MQRSHAYQYLGRMGDAVKDWNQIVALQDAKPELAVPTFLGESYVDV